MSVVRLICDDVTPIRSNTGEGGIDSSFGETRPAFVSFCCAFDEKYATSKMSIIAEVLIADLIWQELETLSQLDWFE